MTVRPNLSEVTLVSVSSVALPATVTAMERSLEQVDFAGALLLSHRLPDIAAKRIEWRPIRPISSRRDYSSFMLRELADHIHTPFALCVQWDGYVLSGSHWREEFLDHDYTGAPWPHFDDLHRVGNGGFSLRSKRLLEACREVDCTNGEAEDVAIGRTHRAWLETAKGIRFAPEDLARHFSFERHRPTGSEFGFHGVFNMRSLLGRDEFQKLIKSLEPGTLGRKEAREIFVQSLGALDVDSALQTLRNRMATKSLSL